MRCVVRPHAEARGWALLLPHMATDGRGDNRYVIAVNAGSNGISLLEVKPFGASVSSRVGSFRPVV
jgi:hypothetical protein